MKFPKTIQYYLATIRFTSTISKESIFDILILIWRPYNLFLDEIYPFSQLSMQFTPTFSYIYVAIHVKHHMVYTNTIISQGNIDSLEKKWWYYSLVSFLMFSNSSYLTNEVNLPSSIRRYEVVSYKNDFWKPRVNSVTKCGSLTHATYGHEE